MSNAEPKSAEQDFCQNTTISEAFQKQLCRYCSFLRKCLLSLLSLPLASSVLADIKKQNWSQSGLHLVVVLGEHHWLELGLLWSGKDSTYNCQCHCVLIICFAMLSKAQTTGLIKVPGTEVYWESKCCTHVFYLLLTDPRRGSFCLTSLLQEEFTH